MDEIRAKNKEIATKEKSLAEEDSREGWIERDTRRRISASNGMLTEEQARQAAKYQFTTNVQVEEQKKASKDILQSAYEEELARLAR